MKPTARKREITISIGEYNELLRASEKIAAVKRYIDNASYVSADDIQAILGMKDGKNDVQN